jgi:hypothetical protein
MENVKHLLPKVERYFKTNLHTHTNVSDGKLTPTEIKKAYKDLGYQVLSITDHNVIVDYSNMNEPDFLFLTGIEVEFNHPKYVSGSDRPVYHLNLIAKRHDNLWAPGKITHKFPNAAPFEEIMQCENMDMSYNPEAVNAMIARANEKGFLVTYNHPTWSCQSYPDYAPLKNVWGMEVRNSECCSLGNNDNNERVFKDLLNLGNRILPLGSDDTHKREAIGGAWIMVGAEKLTYESVIEALEKGDLYMSCGPEILGLTMDENVLKITCSNAKRITLETHGRYAKIANAEGEKWLNSAQFDLTDFILRANGNPDAYVRLTVTAPDGTYACSRAYYLNEL